MDDARVNILDFQMSKPPDPYWWIVIPGQPRAWKRVGRSRGRSYNPSKDDEQALAWQVRTIYTEPNPDETHLWGLRAIFYCKNLQRGRMDGDNLIKLVKDALQKLVWENDFQVREGYYLTVPVVEKPRTELLFHHLPTEIGMAGRR